MASLFSGLNTAKAGLMASQTVLDISAQNTSNASTPGYSRQTVNLVSLGTDTGSYRYNSGQIRVGNGVDYSGITQSRDAFLDTRYRNANSANSDWQGQNDTMSQVEDIFNEFSSSSSSDITGLSGQLTDLITNLQKYQNSTSNTAMPATIRATVNTLCFTIQGDYSSLNELADQQKTNLAIVVNGDKTGGGLNSTLDNIASLNKQIAAYETTGQKANDLRDQRNLLLDKLSSDVDITVEEQSNGMVTVKLANDSSHMLVDSSNNVTKLQVNSDKTGVYWDDGNAPSAANKATIQGGTVDAYLQVINGTGVQGDEYSSMGIPYFTKKLNDFANNLGTMLNDFASEYNDPTATPAFTTSPLVSFTAGSAASDITISSEWSKNDAVFSKNYSGTSIGDYCNDLITRLQKSGTVTTTNGSTFSGSLLDYADSFTSDTSEVVSNTKNRADAASSTLSDIDTQRQAVSSVSIDEEGINIIKYTQSYNACSRLITAIDEMLDKLINSTGTVGR